MVNYLVSGLVLGGAESEKSGKMGIPNSVNLNSLIFSLGVANAQRNGQSRGK